MSVSYAFDSIPWTTTEVATARALYELGFRSHRRDPAGFEIFERNAGAETPTRMLIWFAPSHGLVRVTAISSFADSTGSLVGFRRSLVRFVDRHGPPVRQVYGLVRGKLVAYADWWDEAGNALQVTWRPDVAVDSHPSFLIVEDHVAPHWWDIAPKRSISHMSGDAPRAWGPCDGK